MNITVSLMSKEKGEIKKFLDKYYGTESGVEEDIIEWIYVYRNAAKALDVVDVKIL